MSTFGNLFGDLLDVQLHRLGISMRQHKTDGFPAGRAYRPEYIGGYKLLLPDSSRAGSFFRPSSSNTSLLTDPSFILKPYINRGWFNIFRQFACRLRIKVF